VPELSPENMTGIGVALAKATTLLERSTATSKVIVFLSDGENNVPDIDPEQAAKLAKDAGISVHCIGVGRGQVIEDPFFGRRVFRPEFKGLKAIAKITDGQFHAATSGDELGEVYAVIDELEKIELEDPRFRTVELFVYPFLLGALLFLLQLLVEFLWILRVP
jgi:Ca-activated chloride channel family protein